MMVALVIIESPYSGDIATNVEYLLECMHDSYGFSEGMKKGIDFADRNGIRVEYRHLYCSDDKNLLECHPLSSSSEERCQLTQTRNSP